MPHLDLVALVVREYDPAIAFFVQVLGFELIEDAPSLTNRGTSRTAGSPSSSISRAIDGTPRARSIATKPGIRFVFSCFRG